MKKLHVPWLVLYELVRLWTCVCSGNRFPGSSEASKRRLVSHSFGAWDVGWWVGRDLAR